MQPESVQLIRQIIHSAEDPTAEVPAVNASPHQLHLRGNVASGRPSPPGSPHRTNVGFSRAAEPSHQPGWSLSRQNVLVWQSRQIPSGLEAPAPPPPKELELPSPPEHPVSPGAGPMGAAPQRAKARVQYACVGNSMLATKSKASTRSLRPSNWATIPRFWWPKRDHISGLGQEYKDQIHEIFVKQGITDGIKTDAGTWEQCEPIVTDVFKLSKYFAAGDASMAPIFHKMKVFYDIIDRSSISKRDAMMVPTPVPITEMMVIGWASRKIQPEDPTLSFYSVVKKDHNDWIEKEDFDIFLHAILMTHPGLDFLLETQEFQDRYSDTVTSRIFYIYDRKGTGRIQLASLRRYQPSIVETWKQLEEFDDMKMIRDYFSYEHFYVIYCTFWELDSDHDFLLDKDDLLKYDGPAPKTVAGRAAEKGRISDQLSAILGSLRDLLGRPVSWTKSLDFSGQPTQERQLEACCSYRARPIWGFSSPKIWLQLKTSLLERL
ncbi:unnamed protein product [Effrenium voratum]|nr:unnamed protein product [Effrenium voratum]